MCVLVDGGDGVGWLGRQTDRIWDMRAMIIIDALPPPSAPAHITHHCIAVIMTFNYLKSLLYVRISSVRVQHEVSPWPPPWIQQVKK